jgi:hypothetical protein
MEKFVIFYEHSGDCGYVYVDAIDLNDALIISSGYSRRTGRRVVGSKVSYIYDAIRNISWFCSPC